MAKNIDTTRVKLGSFTSGKSVFKADRNATGTFEVTSFEASSYTTRNGNEANKVALNLAGPEGDVTFRLDFNESWQDNGNTRRRYSGVVLDDVKTVVSAMQTSSADEVSKTDIGGASALAKALKRLNSGKVKVSIVPGSAKNEDGLYPLVLEWA